MKELPTMISSQRPVPVVVEMLKKDGPHMMTADGEPVYVVMTPEDYAEMLPLKPNSSRQPKMARIEGIMYREIV